VLESSLLQHRAQDLSLLQDRALDLSFLHDVVPADALRSRRRPRAPIVAVGLTAFRPDRAVLHRSCVPKGR
jgi:hypothetical protein